MARVVVVRHARPVVQEGVAPSEWVLAPDAAVAVGRLGGTLALGEDAVVASSTERKAVETAHALSVGKVPASHPSFDEVRRPWIEDPAEHRESSCRYLSGSCLEGWEAVAGAVQRFQAGVEQLGGGSDLVIVTHGTVMTAWLAAAVGLDDPCGFWTGLQMPDAWEVDTGSRSLRRIP